MFSQLSYSRWSRSMIAPLATEWKDAPAYLRRRELNELRDELRACQRRLGTAAEASGDIDWARALAHEINNRLQAEYLRAVLARQPATPSLDLMVEERLVA